MNLKLSLKTVSSALAFTMIYLTSGALELLKDGGAREEGPANALRYDGVLNYLVPIWLISSIVCILIVFQRKKIKTTDINKPITLTLMLCFLSSIWAPYPLQAFQTSILLSAIYLLIVTQCSLLDTNSTIKYLSGAVTPLLILSIIFIVFVPSYGISTGKIHEGKWQGAFDHKNGLGGFAALALCIYLGHLYIERTIYLYIKLALATALIIGSASFTAIATIPAAAIIYTIMKSKTITNAVSKIKYLILTLFLLLSVSAVFISLSTVTHSIQDKDTSFSGRNFIWGYILNQSLNAPILGHGLNQLKSIASGNSSELYHNIGFVVGSAHNGFLETFYSLGSVGLVLALILLSNPLKIKNRTLLPFMLLLVFSMVINNTFEAKFLSFNIYFVILMYAITIQQKNSKIKSPTK